MQPVQSPPMLTVGEVARRLRVSKSTVYRWVHEDVLTAVRHGKQWSRGQEGRGGAIRIPESALAAVLTSAAAAPSQNAA
jgi:excisionase family DNA binding protein